MHTLLFHLGALGDWVLTFPLLRALPSPRLAITQWSRARLAQRMIEAVQPVDIDRREFTRLFADGGPAALSPDVEAMFDNAGLVVSFISDGRDAWAENVARLAPGAKLHCIAARPPSDHRGHITAFHTEQLRHQGLDLPEPQLPPPRSTPGGPVVVHPGSGGRDKCWPLERFIELARGLNESGRAVAFLIGEVERERWSAREHDRLAAAGPVHAPRDCTGIFDLLEGAWAFVGNDSGPGHLAAQMGLRTVCLFGPSNPVHWAPIGPDVRLLAPPTPQPMDWLRVDAVLDALTRPRPPV